MTGYEQRVFFYVCNLHHILSFLTCKRHRNFLSCRALSQEVQLLPLLGQHIAKEKKGVVQAMVRETVQEVVQKPAQDTRRGLVQKTVQEPVQESVQVPVQNPVQEARKNGEPEASHANIKVLKYRFFVVDR